ncbi:MAG: type I DNA topoisomerase [Patescibacteria group bacterium]
MKLIVVESPTKARTLTKFLGSDYKIEASMGHVRDLPKSKIGVDVEHNFEPEYEVVKGKQAIITKLKQLAKQSNEVILATDPDREGEAIAWHIQSLLPKAKFTRITFHEITKEAINEALKHPGEVDLKLVNAQQARRVLDRLVGYNLSPVLWRKVRRGLSAGRVQSVAVRLIVEREAEIAAFKPTEFWEITVEVKKDKDNFKVKTNKLDPADSAEICEALKTAKYEVGEIKTRLIHPTPLPPLMTSTMQRTAGNRFGWSAKKTMREAQQLYEQGLITYHRTDSLNLNIEAINQARSLISKKFGPEYVPEKPNFYKTKAKTSQEAHEAIRPTNVNQEIVEVGQGADKLYRLIWERMVMSQMKAAEVEKTTVWVLAKNNDKEYKLSTQGERVVFPGWMAAGKKLPIDIQLPKLQTGDMLELVEVMPEQKFTQPPARFTESALIKVLEEKGIGRPSTFAPIISTIQDRNYVEKKEQKLWPTVIGEAVTKFLLKYFATIMDYEFTAGMEENLDKVETGEISWQNLLKNFYKDFESKLMEVKEKAERVVIETEKTGEKCPECKDGDVVIRTGRFGKFLSCSKFPECKYTKNYKEVLKDFKCPDCGSEVVIKKTKRGKQFYGCGNYPKCKWASWNKPKSLRGESS